MWCTATGHGHCAIAICCTHCARPRKPQPAWPPPPRTAALPGAPALPFDIGSCAAAPEAAGTAFGDTHTEGQQASRLGPPFAARPARWMCSLYSLACTGRTGSGAALPSRAPCTPPPPCRLPPPLKGAPSLTRSPGPQGAPAAAHRQQPASQDGRHGGAGGVRPAGSADAH